MHFGAFWLHLGVCLGAFRCTFSIVIFSQKLLLCKTDFEVNEAQVFGKKLDSSIQHHISMFCIKRKVLPGTLCRCNYDNHNGASRKKFSHVHGEGDRRQLLLISSSR